MGLQLLILQMMELRRLSSLRPSCVSASRSRLPLPGSFPKLGRSFKQRSGPHWCSSRTWCGDVQDQALLPLADPILAQLLAYLQS